MRKITALFLLAVVISVSGCSGGADVLRRVTEEGSIRVLASENSEPYAYLADDGTWAGDEIDIAKEIADDLGVELVIVPVSKQDLLTALSEEKGDIAIGRIERSDRTDRKYAVSLSYGTGRLFIVTPRSVYFPTLGSLGDVDIGVTEQLSGENSIAVAGAAHSVRYYKDMDLVEHSLVNGTIAAYVCYEEQVSGLMDRQTLQANNISGSKPEEYVVVARKESGTEALVERVSDTITRLLENGELGGFSKL
ncbi:MAG: transporter substrate-binding domain-containing protein [Clostridiales Family XIII bacterium]|nr:transporter substrate-binding domain-containing protein [Clostridiales Family XIII bacterium]